jgi:hypothetical protein
MNKQVFVLICFLSILASQPAWSQKRPPKQKDQQTVENAQDREAAKMAERQAQYGAHKDHLTEIQSKETQKRMKKTLKKAQKHSQGKLVPWHKRVFRKRKV